MNQKLLGSAFIVSTLMVGGGGSLWAIESRTRC
jgi:hypothetical protein